MFDNFRNPHEQARRPVLSALITVAVFAGSEFVSDPWRWYVLAFGAVMVTVSILITWQWLFATYITDIVRWKETANQSPASVTANALRGLDAEGLALLGQLHTLKVGVVPNGNPEIMIYGTGLTLDKFLDFLDECDNYRLISVRDYADGPRRMAASEFVQYCVVQGWAMPAKASAENQPATWITGWNKWRVKQQFGYLLAENSADPRAESAPEGVE